MQSSVEIIQRVELDQTANCPPEDVLANIKAALALGLPEFREEQAHDKIVCIVGGGPSLSSTLPSLRARWQAGAAVWALNGAHDWLVEHDVEPDAAWLVDSRAHNARFFRKIARCCDYLISSRCHPLVFETLTAQGAHVTLWHDANAVCELTRDKLKIGGGTTVGMRAIVGAAARGFREIHLYGYDSSYSEYPSVKHHAYPQPTNDGETLVEVEVDGRHFLTAVWMLGQVKNFGALAPALARQGCDIHVHGDGMLPWVAQSIGRQLQEAA